MDRSYRRPTADHRPTAIRRPPKIETLLVVLPGVGTLEPEKWRDDTGISWLEAIPADIAPGLGVFVFPHLVNASDNDLWQKLVDGGPTFASNLNWLVEHEKISHCPIVIVAHSLGGLVVKEALCFMYEHGAEYRQLLRSLAAIVLLGTPHSTDKGKWNDFSNVLHTGSGTQKKRAMTNIETVMLAESSMKFEHAGVTVPTISVYETQKTKVRKTMGFTQKIMLIDRSFVVTRANDEQFIGLDADHRGLCNIDVRDTGFGELCNMLKVTLEDARLSIVNGTPKYRAPTILDSWTVADDEEFSELAIGNRDGKDQTNSSSDPTSRSDPLSMYVASTVGTASAPEPVQAYEGELDRTKGPALFPIFMMPIAKNKDFFGRSDHLLEIEAALLGEEQDLTDSVASFGDVPRTFAICGPGGMGKTQLAAEFVHKYQSRFDAVFWIYADKTAKIADGFGRIASSLKLIDDDSPDARDPVVLRELVRGWLANPTAISSANIDSSSKPVTWLLVFDNADDPDELEDYWPLDGSGCVLFTSRDPYTKNSNYLARQGIDLAGFVDEEAAQFLSRMTKRKDDGTKIAQLLGGLPLAITQMAGVIVRRALSFEEFVRQYEEEESHRELFEHKTHIRSRHVTYEHNLASVWALENLKHGAVLLNTLAFLDPDGVHERILTQNPHQVALKTFPRTTTTYLKAREELLQCSIVQKDKLAKRIMVHRLIQDAARSKMSEEQYRDMFTTALTLVSSIWPFDQFGWRHEVARWRVCEELFPHVLRLRDLSQHVEPPVGEHPDDLAYVKLMNDAGWYHHECGNSAEAASFFKLAQAAAERLKTTCAEKGVKFLHQLDIILAEIHHNLGCVGTETNDPEGTLRNFQAFQKLIMGGAVGSADRADLENAIAWNELGNAWMLNKDWKQGKECFTQSINLTKSTPNYDPTNMSFPMVNLGLAYWMLGSLNDAETTLQEGLRHREDKYGRDDTTSFITGRFFHALGNVALAQGFLEESFQYHRRGLKQYLATIGKNHHRTADMHVKIAEHQTRHKQYDDARHHLDEALRVFRGRNVLQPELCRALFKRGIVLEKMGDSDTAAANRGESIKIYRVLRPQTSRADQDFSEEDLDNVVAFWSR